MTLDSSNMIIIYDDECELCCLFAGFGRKINKSYRYIGWLEFWRDPPVVLEGICLEKKVLCVFDGERLFQDEEAWRKILEDDPRFQKIAWLAKRLGVEERKVVLGISRVGSALRRFCWNCSPSSRRRQKNPQNR